MLHFQINADFKGFHMQDAHEFLVRLFDTIHTEIEKLEKKQKNGGSSENDGKENNATNAKEMFGAGEEMELDLSAKIEESEDSNCNDDEAKDPDCDKDATAAALEANTPISANFMFEVQKSITCSRCGHVSELRICKRFTQPYANFAAILGRGSEILREHLQALRSEF